MDKRSKRYSVSSQDRINDNPSTVQRKGSHFYKNYLTHITGFSEGLAIHVEKFDASMSDFERNNFTCTRATIKDSQEKVEFSKRKTQNLHSYCRISVPIHINYY